MIRTLIITYVVSIILGGLFVIASLKGLPPGNTALSVVASATLLVASGPIAMVILGLHFAFDVFVVSFLIVGLLSGLLVVCVPFSGKWPSAVRLLGVVLWCVVGIVGCLALIHSGV